MLALGRGHRDHHRTNMSAASPQVAAGAHPTAASPLAPTGGERVSVIVRARSRNGDIIRLMQSLCGQSLLPHEVVVIDSGTEPQYLELLRGWGRDGLPHQSGAIIRVHLIEIPGNTYQSARALNHAIREATGDLMAIISQDALPANPDYLLKLVEAMRDPAIAGAYGRQILEEKYSPIGDKDLTKTYPPTSRTQRAPDCWFVNTCSIVRRTLWERENFDEAALISEDHAWGKWAQDQGYAIRYEAEAIVHHWHYDDTLRDTWKRFYNEGRGLAYIHREGPGLLVSVGRWLREMASDLLWLVRRGLPWYWPQAAIARTLKHAGLYLGHREGLRAARGEQAVEPRGA